MDTIATAEVPGLKVAQVHAERRVSSRGVVHRPPFVDAPTHDGRCQRLHTECPARRHCAHLVVEAPDDSVRRRLRQRDTARRSGGGSSKVCPSNTDRHSFRVLGMCPDEGHGRPRRMADIELAAWNIGAVPDLFGKKARIAGHLLHRVHEMLGGLQPAGGELVMRPLPCQQWPRATNPSPVVRPPIRVLTVSVPLIPVPRGAARRFDLQRRINDLDCAQDPRIVGCTTETDERERVEADHQRCRQSLHPGDGS